MTKEDYKNIQTLLITNKFSLTVDESVVLVNLVNKIGDTIKKMEAEPIIHKTTTDEIKTE